MKKHDEQYVPLREAFASNLRAIKLWRKLVPGLFASILCYKALQAVAPYATVYFAARLLDELAGRRDAAILMRWVLITLCTEAVLAVLTAFTKRWYNMRMGEDVTYQKYSRLFVDKRLSMDFGDADGSYAQDLDSQINQNANWGMWGLLHTVYDVEALASGLFQLLGAAALCFSLFTLPVPEGSALSWVNHPLFLAGAVIVILSSAFIAPMLSSASQSIWARFSKTATFGNRIFSFCFNFGTEPKRASDARIYRQDIYCSGAYREDTAFSTHGVMFKLAKKGRYGLIETLSGAASQLPTGLVYLFVCLKALGGAFGVGAVTQYVASITAFSAGLSDAVKALGSCRNNAFFLRDTFAFLDIPNAMYQGSLTVEKRSDRKYDIEFRDVSFKYPGSDAWALRHVNMRFQVGERLAVVGRNGSGKTTFIKLLCRLYDPTEGVILLNGIDIRKYNYREYMSVFSVVFQDYRLFGLPLGQNVAAGVDYDAERVKKCLNEAGFGERLKSLDRGLDTPLYRIPCKDGVDVSGGEAQKIAIARALYKDAPFIILDEPTAALDPVAEYEIYSKFDEIVGDKTAIYISHRLSSCRFCDEIAVFDHGEVVQKDTHDHLLSDESGLYAQLWNAQAQYYAETADAQAEAQKAGLAPEAAV